MKEIPDKPGWVEGNADELIEDMAPTEGRLVPLEDAKRRPRRTRKPPPEVKLIRILLVPGIDAVSWDDGWLVELSRPILVDVPEDCFRAAGDPD